MVLRYKLRSHLRGRLRGQFTRYGFLSGREDYLRLRLFLLGTTTRHRKVGTRHLFIFLGKG